MRQPPTVEVIDLNARLHIERLGARGEGVSRGRHGLIFTPYALPGEEIVAEVDGDRGKLVEILKPSPDRIPAPCPHFTVCGGCAVQTLGRALLCRVETRTGGRGAAQRRRGGRRRRSQGRAFGRSLGRWTAARHVPCAQRPARPAPCRFHAGARASHRRNRRLPHSCAGIFRRPARPARACAHPRAARKAARFLRSPPASTGSTSTFAAAASSNSPSSKP